MYDDSTIYDASMQRLLPRLPRCHLIYEREFWRKGTTRESRQVLNPDPRRVAEAASKVPDNALVVADIETLAVHDVRDKGIDEVQLERNRDLLCNEMDRLRTFLRGQRLSLYAMGSPGYGRELDHMADELEAAAIRLAQDQSESGQYSHRGLIDRLDFICPPLYDRYGDFADRAEKTILFCRRWQRPILPFLMPRYHPDHDDAELRNELIPLMEWKAMLEFCLERCDGVLLWTNRKETLGEWSEVVEKLA